MKTLLRRVRSHPRYSKIFEWGMLISVMGSAQMMIQGLGLLSGFLIVHMLTTEEYAYYTLAYTMFGTLVALADAGISNGVLAHGAKNWRDEQALGKVVVTGIALRRKFALISLAVSFPILFVLLTRHGAAWQFSLLILLALGPTFYASLTEDLLEIPSKLHQDILTLQKNQLVANGGRLVFLGIGLFALPWAAMAILANGLPRIWANIQLRKIAEKFTDFSQPEQAQIRTDILKMVKRALPGAIYYCLSSQLSIWLISIYGNTESIAQIGALGRLAAILTVVGAMFSTLIVPRFARQPERAAGLLRSFFLVMAVLVLICVIGSGLAAVFVGINEFAFSPSQEFPFLSICALMLLAMLLCLCSTTDAFVIAAFAPLPFTAKLAFLIAGPIIDLKLYWLYQSVFQRKFVQGLWIRVVFGTLLLVWLYSWRPA